MAWSYDIPSFSGLDDFIAKWPSLSAKLTDERRTYYENKYFKPLQDLLPGWSPETGTWDTSKWPQYNPVAWEGSDWQERYNQQQSGMDALMARIQGGPTAADETQAMETIAARYGMSPASWTAMQQGILPASGVMTEAQGIAMQPTEYTQEQDRAARIAQRTTMEAVSKQIEAIFGEKGTAQGFAAAYEMTSQMQNTFAQQQAQRSLEYFDRALSAVNSQNDYYKDLIGKGAIQAGDYIKWRFDQLSTAYQDYMIGMEETRSAYAQLESVNQAQFQTEMDGIAKQVDIITSALATEMGFDLNQLQIMQDIYETTIQPILDQEAQKEKDAQVQAGFWTGIITIGLSFILAPLTSGASLLGLAQGATSLINAWFTQSK